MAVITLPARTPSVTPATLSAARAAYVERVDAAMIRAQQRCSIEGMPYRLISAGCFLAANGVAAPACDGEFYFGTDLTECRRYLDGLSPATRAAEIEEGRKVLFEGRRAIVAASDLQVAA